MPARVHPGHRAADTERGSAQSLDDRSPGQGLCTGWALLLCTPLAAGPSPPRSLHFATLAASQAVEPSPPDTWCLCVLFPQLRTPFSSLWARSVALHPHWPGAPGENSGRHLSCLQGTPPSLSHVCSQVPGPGPSCVTQPCSEDRGVAGPLGRGLRKEPLRQWLRWHRLGPLVEHSLKSRHGSREDVLRVQGQDRQTPGAPAWGHL